MDLGLLWECLEDGNGECLKSYNQQVTQPGTRLLLQTGPPSSWLRDVWMTPLCMMLARFGLCSARLLMEVAWRSVCHVAFPRKTQCLGPDTGAVVVQSLSHVQFFATPWSAAHQVSLSFTISWSLFRLVSIELVMPSNCLILCCPLLLQG